MKWVIQRIHSCVVGVLYVVNMICFLFVNKTKAEKNVLKTLMLIKLNNWVFNIKAWILFFYIEHHKHHFLFLFFPPFPVICGLCVLV